MRRPPNRLNSRPRNARPRIADLSWRGTTTKKAPNCRLPDECEILDQRSTNKDAVARLTSPYVCKVRQPAGIQKHSEFIERPAHLKVWIWKQQKRNDSFNAAPNSHRTAGRGATTRDADGGGNDASRMKAGGWKDRRGWCRVRFRRACPMVAMAKFDRRQISADAPGAKQPTGESVIVWPGEIRIESVNSSGSEDKTLRVRRRVLERQRLGHVASQPPASDWKRVGLHQVSLSMTPTVWLGSAAK